MTDTTDIRDELEVQRLELLRRRLAERGLRTEAQHDEAASTSLSDGQRRMWFVQSADTTGALLNICVSYRLTGDVDVARLHDAVNAVARRHSVLRTTYAADADGEPQSRPRRPDSRLGRSTTCPSCRITPADCVSKCSRSASSPPPST